MLLIARANVSIYVELTLPPFHYYDNSPFSCLICNIQLFLCEIFQHGAEIDYIQLNSFL